MAPGKFFEDDTDVASLLIGGYSVSKVNRRFRIAISRRRSSSASLQRPVPALQAEMGWPPTTSLIQRFSAGTGSWTFTDLGLSPFSPMATISC